MRKTIVVLASSVKHQGRCIAGKDVATGMWIRPVGDVDGKELTLAQATYTNPYGQYEIKNLIKIEINFTVSAPLYYQPENFLFSQGPFQQQYTINKNDLANLLDSPMNLWGETDNVDPHLIETNSITISQSLYLVRVDNLNLHLDGNNKRRASFTYNNINYDLAVTCRNFDSYVNGNETSVGIICVSLGELFRDRHWKIVAAIY
ncbi:hypothetical protein MRP04_20970 [Dickeya dianthicola]|uniref:dual OB domain-containing protein n=1 Tax=Dickeya dianthicola TaxID=204039 RepID=UPI001F62017F|nr:hypothetical protein [Dickeya dianthicola]MCI4032935.1 hypothetical protein [Dickeya dianthicola]MCI4173140.1 hypothetical protein [Dickeya dianthicola]MCI4177239.1 hypothetical protein [Dickeya dianthicola]MCI4183639.1 hypothetical protein [Dickeya dianthicola]MCI4196991.1 hypothetical protein [Dickeya dianthicola]